uniref:Uncharacterized protein n=1 Tax=Sphaerodactylus townsendi TaxID=933632 RepID=A0ACB8F1Y4_9SAUR
MFDPRPSRAQAPNAVLYKAFLLPSSLALSNGERMRAISDYLTGSKKRKSEEKDYGTDYGSDGEKSEDNLVVDEVGAEALDLGLLRASCGVGGGRVSFVLTFKYLT